MAERHRVARVREDDEVESLEVRAIAVERLTFFADAVIAIAITLLALDLPVPTGGTNRELLHSVGEHYPEYIAFLISFLVVGAHWRGHHRTFRYVTLLGGQLPRLTMYWLLMQVITPFATRVLTAGGAFQVRFTFYALVQASAALVFLLMLQQLRRHRLLRADTPQSIITDATWRGALLAAAFLISIPFSFVSKPVAYGCWALIPLSRGLVRGAITTRRRADRTEGPPSAHP
jgi:TMEM175 potassium channel family protein